MKKSDEDKLGSFFFSAVNEMAKQRVDIHLINKRHVRPGVGGEFCEYPKVAAIACGRKIEDWFPTFIHEYCHFRQHKDRLPIYMNSDDSFNNIWNSLEGEDKMKRGSIDVIQKVELDCEKRVVEIIKEYDLPFSVDQYIREANVHVLMYNEVYRYKKWFEISPFIFEEIYSTVPDSFQAEKWYKKSPEKYKEISSICFNEKD